jgi:hypothetical protein
MVVCVQEPSTVSGELLAELSIELSVDSLKALLQEAAIATAGGGKIDLKIADKKAQYDQVNANYFLLLQLKY